jgi:DNA polymerase-1
MTPINSLHIIDGSSLLYRSYYGVRPLHTATGISTQAIYGFCRTLKKITDDLKPSNLIIVWDSKGLTTRHAEYADYKATRQAPPSDLLTQKNAIIEFLTIIGVAQLSAPGHEADDLIYSLIQEHPTVHTTVITGDKDLHQLLSPVVSIFDPFKQITITLESFVFERHFTPQDLLLYHSLLGDSSDNIPGVKGIGAKTAEKLAQEYHTITSLYEAIDNIKPARVQELLLTQKTEALISEKLFTLRYHKTNFALKESRYTLTNWNNAVSFFKAHEIKPFLPNSVTAVAPTEINPATPPCNTHIITTSEQLHSLITTINTQPLIAADTETTSLQPFRDELVGISFSWNETDGYYIPFGHSTGEQQLSIEEVIAAVKPIFASQSIGKIFHHAKFDQSGLARYGITLNGVVGDTLIIASLLRTGSESIGLKALSSRLLHEEMTDYSAIAKGKKTFADVAIQTAALYAANDARQTWRLYHVITQFLRHEPSLQRLYTEVELPLSGLLWRMEEYGIHLNVPFIKELATHAQEELDSIITKITACLHGGQQSIVAPTLNLNSPQQVEVLLFDQLKLPSLKKNVKTQSRSTDSEVLHELSKIHPVPGLIIQYRELSKLLSTYLLPLPNEINPRTGKIHTTYTQTITATGRLSSTNPNLQNIPTSNTIGAKVRDAFIAPTGYVFVSADYSQIELRILAQFSQDTALINAFSLGHDIHVQTGALIFGCTESDITPAQRAIGKKINFSIMYGLTPFGLSKDLGISPADAKRYIESYFAQYAGVKIWMDALILDAKETGYVSTLLGRRRAVPGLNERNKNVQDAERRVAINTPIQGTSADIIKMAMLKLDKEITKRQLDAHLVLQIHDELIVAVKKEAVDNILPLIKECMNSIVPDWNVPLEVSLRVGDTWGAVSK